MSASGGGRLLQMVSESDTGRCASEEAESQRGVDSVPARTLGPKGGGLEVTHRLEKGTSVSEYAGPRRGWIVRSQSFGEENKTFFIRVWKTLPNRRTLKTLKRSPKGKT